MDEDNNKNNEYREVHCFSSYGCDNVYKIHYPATRSPGSQRCEDCGCDLLWGEIELPTKDKLLAALREEKINYVFIKDGHAGSSIDEENCNEIEVSKVNLTWEKYEDVITVWFGEKGESIDTSNKELIEKIKSFHKEDELKSLNSYEVRF